MTRSKSFADHIKTAETNFFDECAKLLNSKQKYVKAKVNRGLSVSFLEYEGTDSSDLALEGTSHLSMTGAHDLSVTVSFKSAYRGTGDDRVQMKTGELTPEHVVRMIMRNIGVSGV